GEVEGGRPARDGAVQVGDGEGQGGGLRLADGLRGPGGDLGRLVDDDVRADEGGAPVVHLDRVEPVRPGVGEEVRGPDVHGGRLCGSQVDAGEVQRPGGRGGVVADVDLDVDHARRGAAAVVPLRLDAVPAVDGPGAGRRRPEHGPRGVLHLDGPSPGDGDTEELAAGVADVDDVERGQRAATVVDRHGAGGGRADERQAHDRSDGAAADEA